MIPVLIDDNVDIKCDADNKTDVDSQLEGYELKTF